MIYCNNLIYLNYTFHLVFMLPRAKGSTQIFQDLEMEKTFKQGLWTRAQRLNLNQLFFIFKKLKFYWATEASLYYQNYCKSSITMYMSFKISRKEDKLSQIMIIAMTEF